MNRHDFGRRVAHAHNKRPKGKQELLPIYEYDYNKDGTVIIW